MAETSSPVCPHCNVALTDLGTSTGSISEYDRLDDPALERWKGFRCPSCQRAFNVNSKTGQLRELRP